MHPRKRGGRAVAICALLTGLTTAQDPQREDPLASLSLEELLEVDIQLVTKRDVKLRHAPGAATVITREDIRRSGFTSVPELLRLVPGFHVARINASTWAISCRGFNNEYAGKLLVLIDGRSVYTPLFSGVYWDVQDLVLEDIEQIEVIRGPGGARWGANAVNGVVNILTRSARDTQGTLFAVTLGSEEKRLASLRHGFALNEDDHVRVDAGLAERDDQARPDGTQGADDWDLLRASFRADFKVDDRTSWMLQGAGYGGNEATTVTTPVPAPPYMVTSGLDTDVAGGHLLGRWTHTTDDGAQTRAQIYWDATYRQNGEFLTARFQTFDFDLQHDFSPWERHAFTAGLGYRRTDSRMDDSVQIRFDPDDRAIDLFSAFVQDEIELAEGRLFLTLGLKVEHNAFTGVEFQPDARLAWRIQQDWTGWAAVARAVRTPSFASEDGTLEVSSMPGMGVPIVQTVIPSSDVEAEELLAGEVGLRGFPRDNLTVDLAAFYYDYDDLVGYEAGTPFPSTDPYPRVVVPLSTRNNLQGSAYGGELACSWRVAEAWQLHGSYSLQITATETKTAGAAVPATNAEDTTPRHQAQLRSQWNLGDHWEIDAMLYYYDRVEFYDVGSFLRADLRVGWRPDDRNELGLVLQNLIDERHQEYGSNFYTVPTEVERGVYVYFRTRF